MLTTDEWYLWSINARKQDINIEDNNGDAMLVGH